MAASYSILVDVELNTANVQSQLDDISGKMKFNTNALTSAGKEVGLTYQAAYTIFSKCTDAIGSMVEQVMELDAATIELQKVSDLQGKALETYIDNLGKSGQSVARTTSEMVEAATMFRKSGFNDSDSAMLAEIAAMYQNVADTEVSASDAAASIVSQLRAFGEGADYATHVIDAYNEV